MHRLRVGKRVEKFNWLAEVLYAGSNCGDFNVKFLNIELAGYNYGGYAHYGHAQFEGVHTMVVN